MPDRERAEHLLRTITEEIESYIPDDAGVGVEFFEPAGDWYALISEVERLREENKRLREAQGS